MRTTLRITGGNLIVRPLLKEDDQIDGLHISMQLGEENAVAVRLENSSARTEDVMYCAYYKNGDMLDIVMSTTTLRPNQSLDLSILSRDITDEFEVKAFAIDKSTFCSL